MNTINKLELFPISVWQIHSGIDTTNLHTVSLSLKDNLHYGKSAGVIKVEITLILSMSINQ